MNANHSGTAADQQLQVRCFMFERKDCWRFCENLSS